MNIEKKFSINLEDKNASIGFVELMNMVGASMVAPDNMDFKFSALDDLFSHPPKETILSSMFVSPNDFESFTEIGSFSFSFGEIVNAEKTPDINNVDQQTATAVIYKVDNDVFEEFNYYMVTYESGVLNEKVNLNGYKIKVNTVDPSASLFSVYTMDAARAIVSAYTDAIYMASKRSKKGTFYSSRQGLLPTKLSDDNVYFDFHTLNMILTKPSLEGSIEVESYTVINRDIVNTVYPKMSTVGLKLIANIPELSLVALKPVATFFNRNITCYLNMLYTDIVDYISVLLDEKRMHLIEKEPFTWFVGYGQIKHNSLTRKALSSWAVRSRNSKTRKPDSFDSTDLAIYIKLNSVARRQYKEPISSKHQHGNVDADVFYKHDIAFGVNNIFGLEPIMSTQIEETKQMKDTPNEIKPIIGGATSVPNEPETMYQDVHRDLQSNNQNIILTRLATTLDTVGSTAGTLKAHKELKNQLADYQYIVSRTTDRAIIARLEERLAETIGNLIVMGK